jgi:formylglycine-generating enzyme
MSQQQLGNYNLLRQMGKGQMGSGFRAVQRFEHPDGTITLDTEELVIKVLKKEYALDAAYKKLFGKEAREFQKLKVPNTAEILDIIETNDTLAIVTPFYKGRLLSNYIPRTGLPLSEALDILEPIADALDKLHELGMSHGNLTPQNIILDSRGFIPIILDIGIHKNASWMDCIQPSPYRSPEEMKTKSLNADSDRYAFGLITYRILAGTLPWNKRAKDEEIRALKQQDRVHPLSMHCPTIHIDLLSVIMNLLSPDTSRRPTQCKAVIDALHMALATEEQTADIPKVPLEVLEKAKTEVGRLDKMLAGLEQKVRQREDRLKTEENRYRDITNRARVKFSVTENSWEERLEALRVDLNEVSLVEANKTRGFIENIFPTFSSAGKKRKEREIQKNKLEKDLQKLSSESEEALQDARGKMNEGIKVQKNKFENTENKIRKELVNLYNQKKDLEEELLEFGEIHPTLLGFRAKKPFSIAGLKVGKVRQEMLLMPKGYFEMGSLPGVPGITEDEQPAHKVFITRPFWILNSQVTQKLYQAIIGRNPSRFQGANRPVEQVSWQDAIQFCNALSFRDGLQPCYEINPEDEESVRWNRTSSGYRLPTEAEWEYVAKSGKNYLYSGSNTPGEVAWYYTNSGLETHEICQKKPSDWGLYDITGNVWEWCWDWVAPYEEGRASDPMGPNQGKGRIFRGGSWAIDESNLRSAYRGSERPHNKLDGIGFRIVRNAR